MIGMKQDTGHLTLNLQGVEGGGCMGSVQNPLLHDRNEMRHGTPYLEPGVS